ncbi:NAD-dependent epimerase/dehydratase family protein [Lacisediminihabitans sp.]|uniref:NAD-dependent epimerase/dehydratase family protein n=1 Tax=Lacisediminihabitans sp. TaxID=2787631 RepID=UPI00374DB479
MRVLLSGGTGFVGSSILSALTAAGHKVVAIVRSDEAAATVSAAGATALVHSLPDTAWLSGALASSDGFIHAATPGDETGPAFDDSVIDSVIAAYSGTDKPYLHTGGIWVYGDGADLTEDTPRAAPAITAWREERENRLLASGVRASVIAPAIVYGHGKGIPNTIAQAPLSADGALRLIGSGDQHWATVHVDDLADLYVVALESAPGGEIYIAASGQNPTVRELGEAVVGPDGAVVGEDPDATRDRLGAAFADALLLDQQATGAKARAAFGWAPSRPSLVEELAATSARA